MLLVYVVSIVFSSCTAEYFIPLSASENRATYPNLKPNLFSKGFHLF